jgi:glycosyltransferase involved in cell wall biosynthesis
MGELAGSNLSVLINTYNYRRYVGEAVASALAQTLAPIEVVVVDDGSTDGTAEWLRSEFAARDPRVRVISQANAGQLAAIETAVAAATGDVLFFLDADDTWAPDYLAAVHARLAARPDVDYVFSGHVRSDGAPSDVLGETRDRRLGRRSAQAYATGKFPISMTSTLAMRASLARRFLPTPPGLAPEWKTDADQVLALGAALAGGGGDYLSAPRVHYRIHGANHFAGRVRPRDPVSREVRRARTERARAALVLRLGLGPDTVNRIGAEFATIERPNLREFRRALRTAARASGARERLRLQAAVCGSYLARRFAG